MIQTLWATYAQWFTLLAQWASLLVPEPAARRLARRSLAETFILACNGYETTDGPYMHSTDVLYRLMCAEPSQSDTIFVASAFQRMVYPGEDLVEEIARLYSAVYEVSYRAVWTLQDRETIAILIRLFDPTIMPFEELFAGLASLGTENHPVRRAVQLLHYEQCAEELICAAAGHLWHAEEVRGKLWLSRMTSENGVKL